jgi:Domain of unknown function DUF11
MDQVSVFPTLIGALFMTGIGFTPAALRGRGGIILGALAAAVVFAVPAAADTSPPTADLAVVSIHASRQTAAQGTRVTFTEVIRNNGPETVEMDTLPQITGGALVEEVCDLGISPDTPNCEYGDVAAGASLTTKFVVRVTAAHGTLTLRGGVVSESAFEDDNPFNQYRAASVRIG